MRFLLLILSLNILVLAGCNGSARQTPQPLQTDVDIDTLWQISLAELRGRGFDIYFADSYNKTIRTYPLVSKQWFEFWSNDVKGAYWLLHSSLNSTRRIIILEINQAEPLEINCEVIVQQLSYDDGRASSQYRIRRLADMNERELGNSGNYQWYDIGQDQHLARAILKSIDKKLKKSN